MAKCSIFRAVLALVTLTVAFLPATPLSALAQSCTLVELNPGYPGYRGMITGLKGVGDHQCKESLKRMDPEFDIEEQNRQNLSAARRLGISGSSMDWTWENWMTIEVERGLVPQCYACLIFDPGAYPATNGATVNRSDPRLIIGMLSGDFLERHVLGGGNITGAREGVFWRVQAAFLYPDDNLNAQETLDAATWLIEQWRTAGGRTLRTSSAWEEFERKGGYVNLTGKEHPQDQYFQAAAAIFMFTETMFMPNVRNASNNSAMIAFDECTFNKGNHATLGHCVASKLKWFQE